jgi:hypothetical protein
LAWHDGAFVGEVWSCDLAGKTRLDSHCDGSEKRLD